MLLRRLSTSAAPSPSLPAAAPAPCAANSFLLPHVSMLSDSLRRLTGRVLLPERPTVDDARALADDGERVVVSHGTDLPEPIFNYANRAGLELWEIAWDDMVRLPSSRSAEAVERSERQRLLDEVRANGFISNYSGVRVSSKGKRFRLIDALVWDVRDAAGVLRGQACTFERSRVEPL